MPRHLVTIYAMLGRCQAPPPPPPPSSSNIPEDGNDFYFEVDDDEMNLELTAPNTEFRADEEWVAAEEAEAKEDDDDDLDFSDNGHGLEEKAGE
jgi:hypothetical protein